MTTPSATIIELPQGGADRGHLETTLSAALVDSGQLAPADLERALRLQQDQDPPEPLLQVLAKLGLVPERTLATRLADYLGLRLVRADEYPQHWLARDEVAPAFLRSHHCLICAEDEDGITVAMADPLDRNVRRALNLATGREVRVAVAVPSELEAALEAMTDAPGDDAAAGEEIGDVVYEADAERLRELASEAPVVRLVAKLMQRAAEIGASDVHVEPFEERLRIRFRIDGVLREVDSRPVAMASAVISRIKILAGLNIAERRLPQDGRFKVRAVGRDIDLRISTVPSMYGESVVIRLLHRGETTLDFHGLGYGERLSSMLREILAEPNGIVLVTGPTGSGKTTTLYAAMTLLNTEQRKILSVEDPVEYNLEGINQIQVKPQIGLTFASALRSILRQDPDVIMIGEMRDRETAEIAVQSALTGHLVLSTLHTNDAVTSVSRMLDMGVEDYLINASLVAVVAQRLVRGICPHCKVEQPAPVELVRRWQLGQWAGGGTPMLSRGKGCNRCDNTGFQGRTAVAEVLKLNDYIRALVYRRASADELLTAARKEGMQTMLEMGLQRVLAGETTLDEVLRVTRG
ncbi:MAG: GspE/PulE family protein [Gammaproteobacteria bacterium]|nr:GspE/PulE family protein [Gammaproteobacteria bacterium]